MRARGFLGVVLGLALLTVLTAAQDAVKKPRLVTFRGEEPNFWSFASNFTHVHVLPGNEKEPEKLVIADAYGYINIMAPAKVGFRREWKSFHLGSNVLGVFIDDLSQDGRLEHSVNTKDRVFVFDARTHSLLWESVESDFTNISTMAIGEFDGSDKQHEMLILANEVLLIYDGVRYNREWEGTEPYTAQEMVVGDVDGDGEEEVVMNTGFVFGALSHAVEWQTENFGTRIGLIDVDDDGILEVIGETTGGKLNVYDIDKRQEKQDL